MTAAWLLPPRLTAPAKDPQVGVHPMPVADTVLAIRDVLDRCVTPMCKVCALELRPRKDELSAREMWAWIAVSLDPPVEGSQEQAA